jgi:glutathione S-transferase
MKLYYSPGACSLSCHIALQESGLKFETEKVDFADKKTQSGENYLTINAKGYVPALILNNGELFTENAAILQYVADLVPDKKLAPDPKTPERYRLIEWLSYISSEIHKGFAPFFSKVSVSQEYKEMATKKLSDRLDFIDKHLAYDYLMSDTFTVADAYLFTILRWLPKAGLDKSSWPMLSAYFDRVAARPQVQATLKAEGLDKS